MIVVFGTINVDMVTVVPRLPTPGETVKGRDYQLFPGGKGANQAMAAVRAGARVALVGGVGRDAFAEVALADLRAAGVDLSRVARADGPTGLQSIAVDPRGEYLMIGADAANRAARADALVGLLTPGVTLLTQTSLGLAEVEKAIAHARLAGARVVWNAAPAAPVADATIAACDVVIVNEPEARAHAALLALPSDPVAFAAALAERFVVDCVVTRGGEAAIAARPDGTRLACRPPAVEVVDTTGAGDAFCGAFAAALDRSDDFVGALRDGLAAGALCCRAAGARSSFGGRAEIAALAARLAPERIA